MERGTFRFVPAREGGAWIALRAHMSRMALISAAIATFLASSRANGDERLAVKHVLLVSVDGLHEADLARFVGKHPRSTFAMLAKTGVRYTSAHAPTPSDSFPGLLALITGGTPKSTGVYYDDSYDRTLYPPGSECKGAAGTEVMYVESLAKDPTQLFSPIDPGNLPRALDAKGNCKPVYPHDFIRVNTVFEVIRDAGGYTAWSDKHPAYDVANGPTGKGVDDLYTPEINSSIAKGGVVNGVDLSRSKSLCDGKTNSLRRRNVHDYTSCEPAAIAYDEVKVQAVVNEIEGKTADGTKSAPVPTLFGMDFQAVGVGQKLPVGGYADADGTPSALLEGALDHVDHSLARFVAALEKRGLLDSTLIVVAAKHGQSPVDPRKLAMEPRGRGDATVSDPIGAIHVADPNVDAVFAPFKNPNDGSSPAVKGHLQKDDVAILWLQDQSKKNLGNVVAQLTDPANRKLMFANEPPRGTIFESNVCVGEELAEIYGDPTSQDPVAAARAPNVVIQPNWGVIYSGSSKKIAEHGGGSLDDTHVALLVSNTALGATTIDAHVTTTQVAPTILKALGLDPHKLDAVRKEHTKPLPGLPF